MALGRPSRSGVLALLVASGLGIVLALTQRSEGPSRAEVAGALTLGGEPDVRTADLRDLRCDRMAHGYACHWRQRTEGDWRARQGILLIDGNRWRLAPED